jgi:hypothetical protein
MASTTFSSSSVMKSFNDLMSGYPFIPDASSVCHDESMSCIPLGEATLEALAYTLCSNICSLITTDKTVPPQAMYNHIVLNGTKEHQVPEMIRLLIRLANYGGEPFAESSVLTSLRGFKRPSKEEFNDNRSLYVHSAVLDTPLGEVRDIDMIRAARLFVRNIMLRFFRTDDPDEMSENPRTKKMEPRCVPEACTFRRGDRNITTLEFSQFLEDLLYTQRFFLQYSDALDEFSFYKDAAFTAKKMREDFATKRAAEKQTTRDTVRAPNTRYAQTHTKQSKVVKQMPAPVPVQASTPKVLSPPPSKNVWAERKKVSDEVVATTVATPSVVADAKQDPISEEDQEFVEVMVRNARRGNTQRFQKQAQHD